ncbi:C40 family peptidase [uncultured Acetatifactor sp.]|uniref:C40 family peptidase n=1 Tax=uncultured Acetatifactor sp. TaxID=1671927 RepID=UPI00261BA776|nr:C40 family peptidase [uncultured Acetatifactor sp.]
MAHKTKRTAVYLLTATIAFTGMGMTAQASSILPGGGVSLALENGNKLEDVTEDKSSLPIQSIIESIPLANSDAAQAEPTEEDMFRNLVIAQVDSYVNVRSTSSEEGEILGKLYDNSVGTFISEENGWYQINSGSVTGYVKAEYCVTGDAAVEIAKQVGKRIATVTTETLYVRAEASTECDIIGMVPQAADLLVMEETEGWVKVDIEEGQGWISTEYVSLHSEFVQAESREEEERRLAKEEEERRKAQAAAAAAQAAQAAANASTTQEEITYAVSGGSEMGQAVANYALQFVGNPYVYGGTSLTNGADCSGFVMSVYANFGVSLPHSDAGDRTQGYGVDGLANAQPGDIVCYSGHVGIYIGGGQIVHASSSRTGIIVSNAGYREILAIRRIF